MSVNRTLISICDYIDSSEVDCLYNLKAHARVFHPEWMNEINVNQNYYFRYINNRILIREGVKQHGIGCM